MTTEEIKNLFPLKMRIIPTTEEKGAALLNGEVVADSNGNEYIMNDNDIIGVPDKTDERLDKLEADSEFINQRSIENQTNINSLISGETPCASARADRIGRVIDETYVDIENDQTISGDKTFNHLTTFNGKAQFLDGLSAVGDVSIQGNLMVSGDTTTLDTVTLQVQDNVIVANADGAELVEEAGFAMKTSATAAYGIMYDPAGDGVKIGLGSFDDNGKFVYGENEAQFLATRADELGDGNVPQWNSTENRFDDSGVNIGELQTSVTQNKEDIASLENNSIKYNDILQTTNPFGGKKLYISKIDDSLYAADKRWDVTATQYVKTDDSIVNNYNSTEISKMFDGSYESKMVVSAGNYAVISIKKSSGYFFDCPYGDIILSFYYSGIPENVAIRVYCNYETQGVGWKTLPVSDFVNEGTKNVVKKAYNQFYRINEIEITITAPDDISTGVTAIEMNLDRPDSSITPVVSKYKAETLFYNLTAPSFIGRLIGTADQATKDGSGNTITSTYVTNSALTTTLGSYATTDALTAVEAKIPTLPTNHVTTDTAQTISGAKTFSAALTTANITSSGTISAVTFNASSDRRLKENIVDYNPTNSILDLPIKEFNFIGSEEKYIGCTAQDLQEICPEMVVENENGYLSVKESKLVYLLIKEVKELKEELNKLKRGE